jgi:hypothetical protein
MAQYTIFFLDWDDTTVATTEIDCPDDEAALIAATERKAEHTDVEVMCGGRTVGRPPRK